VYRLARALLFLLPAESAHHLTLALLGWLSRFVGACLWWRRQTLARLPAARPVRLAGLEFPSPIGLAAGLDKDAVAVPAFWAMGFGFVEVGTLTPRPQPGNPRPRLFRLPERKALINRMGFNNQGAEAAARRLATWTNRPAPVGVNLGKNKQTPLEEAPADYARCTELLAPVADYLVVNLSSPNTPGLRSLQAPEQLGDILRAVASAQARVGTQRPVFLKIAPDLAPTDLDSAVDVAIAAGIAGLIATNTTLSRPVQHPLAFEAGGLSGAPLESLATETIRRAHARAGARLPIIGVGGIFTVDDAYRKLRAGASLLQIYTGFIYGGPALVAQLLRGLEARLQQDGFSRWEDAIGVDARQAA
jgi:dihydroorotate dehydrogenase